MDKVIEPDQPIDVQPDQPVEIQPVEEEEGKLEIVEEYSEIIENDKRQIILGFMQEVCQDITQNTEKISNDVLNNLPQIGKTDHDLIQDTFLSSLIRQTRKLDQKNQKFFHAYLGFLFTSDLVSVSTEHTFSAWLEKSKKITFEALGFLIYFIYINDWQIENLNLSGKEILKIPDHIGLLTSLKNLDLSSNQLTSLPDSIWGLKNLTSLNLQKNRFQEIKFPSTDYKVKNLTVLNLSRNKFTVYPDLINIQIPNLTNLDLSYNQISSVPSTVCYLESLIVLFLQNNKLTSIPSDLFTSCLNLDSLDLSYNSLKDFHSSALASRLSKQDKQMTYLNVNFNNLSTYAENLVPKIKMYLFR